MSRTDTERLDPQADLRHALGIVVGRMMAWRRGDASAKDCADAICEMLTIIEYAEMSYAGFDAAKDAEETE